MTVAAGSLQLRRDICAPVVVLAGALMAMADADGLGPAKHRATAELAACIVLGIAALLLPQPHLRQSRTLLAAGAAFLGFQALQVQRPVAIYGHGRWLTVATVIAITLPSAGLIIVAAGETVARITYRAMLAAFALGGIAVIRCSPRPTIDVWDLLQHATSCLTHGCNPYTMHTPQSPQLTEGFQYLPGTAYVLTPFHAVLGDVRYGEVAALLLAALLLARLVEGRAGMVAAALVLSVPCTLFGIEQAWTEPLLLAAFVAVAWAWRRGHSVGLVVALAAAFSVKQHAALLAPLALGFLGWRRTVAAGLAAAVVCAPPILVDPHAFWRTAVKVYFNLPGRSDSLSLWLHVNPSARSWLPYAFLALGYVIVWAAVPRTPAGWLIGAGLLLAGFDLANKFSFYNEWQLPAMLLVAGGAVAVCIGPRAGITTE